MGFIRTQRLGGTRFVAENFLSGGGVGVIIKTLSLKCFYSGVRFSGFAPRLLEPDLPMASSR